MPKEPVLSNTLICHSDKTHVMTFLNIALNIAHYYKISDIHESNQGTQNTEAHIEKSYRKSVNRAINTPHLKTGP